MIPWIHVIAFVPLALLGVFLGKRLAATRRGWWVGIAACLAMILLLVLGHRFLRLSFIPPISWVVHATFGPLLMTPTIALLFAALIARLSRGRTRLVSLAMVLFTIEFGLLPGLMPLVVRPSLAATQTLIVRGICRQTHAYTCGPAAAVTCLRRLGVGADEGSLAIDARCGPVVGTNGHALAAAVSQRFASAGIACDYRWFDSLDALPTPAVADMFLPHVGGHAVAVLEVRSDAVVLGDPMAGLQTMPRTEFLAHWLGAASVFTHTARPHSAAQ